MSHQSPAPVAKPKPTAERIWQVDANALASALRLATRTHRRWAAVATIDPNPAMRQVAPRSSAYVPVDYKHGHVSSIDRPSVNSPWWSARFRVGPCDGRGVITPERRERFRRAIEVVRDGGGAESHQDGLQTYRDAPRG